MAQIEALMPQPRRLQLVPRELSPLAPSPRSVGLDDFLGAGRVQRLGHRSRQEIGM